MKKKKVKKIYLFEHLPIQYGYFDCHPNVDDDDDTKIYAANDCSVRALCKVTGYDWETIYNKLFKVAREMNAMPDSIRVITKVAGDYGFSKFEDISCCAAAFMLTHPVGTYMIELEDHIFAYINGVMYDSVNGKVLKKSEIEYEILQDVAAVYYINKEI